MSMKNSNDTIGNRTHDLSACSAVPQPTAPLLASPPPSIFNIAVFMERLVMLPGNSFPTIRQGELSLFSG